MGYVRLILKDLPGEKPRQAARIRADLRGGVILYRADGTVAERIGGNRVPGMSIKSISEDEAYIDYVRHSQGGVYRGIRAWHRSCQFISNDAGESFSKLEATGPVYQFPLSDPARWDRLGPERFILLKDHPDLEKLLTGQITFEMALRMRP